MKILPLLFIATLIAVPNLTFAGNTVILDNPLNLINVNSPGELVVVAFKGFVAIIAAIAIAFTVFSGFKLIVATNEEAINKAKQSLTWSVGGFVVAVLTFTIISGTAKFLGFDPNVLQSNNLNDLRPPLRIPGNQAGDFISVINFLMSNFLAIVGFVTILMIIYYGYRYITSAGNEEVIERAKTGLKWSILGFVVTLLAYVIINAIQFYLVSGGPG